MPDAEIISGTASAESASQEYLQGLGGYCGFCMTAMFFAAPVLGLAGCFVPSLGAALGAGLGSFLGRSSAKAK